MTADEILQELNDERLKFTRADDEKMRNLCNILIEMGIYPEKSGIGYDAFKMMESWGVDWHIYKGVLNCPHCNADLRNLKDGPPFKREIGVYNRDRDRTVEFECPDCHLRWDR